MFTTDSLYMYELARGQGDVRHKRPNVTSAPHCSTFSWNFKRIGISICKPRNYLDYVTWKGKRAMGSSCFGCDSVSIRVTLRQLIEIFVTYGFVRLAWEVLFSADIGQSLKILLYYMILSVDI